MAKGRWLGREILEVVSTEFRDRSMEFYVRVQSIGWPAGSLTMLHVRSVRSATPVNSSCQYTRICSPHLELALAPIAHVALGDGLHPCGMCSLQLIGRLQRYALESGVTTINGKIAKPDTIIQNGDRIE